MICACFVLKPYSNVVKVAYNLFLSGNLYNTVDGSTRTWSQRHVAPAFQEIKATLPADPTLKIQIVRFLVETNLAPEVLDTMSSPQTMERSRWFWMFTQMISWNSILFYVCSSRLMFEEWNNEIADESSFFQILVVTTKDHHIHHVRSFGTAMLPWQTSRWHITSWKSPRTLLLKRPLLVSSFMDIPRFDNQVSSVSWPFLSLEEFIKIST